MSKRGAEITRRSAFLTGAVFGILLALAEGIGILSWKSLSHGAIFYGGVFGCVCILPRKFLPRIPPVLLKSVATLLLFLVAMGVWGNGAWQREANPEHPDILLITLDTTRADRWYEVSKSFGGDGFDEGSFQFPITYTPTGLTAPAHASLFTGLHPHQHGVLNNGGNLSGGVSLPKSLRGAGFYTMAAPSVIHLDPAFGFSAGFQEFAHVEEGVRGKFRDLRHFRLIRPLFAMFGAGQVTRPGAETLSKALQLWESAPPNRPRFLWTHLFEPHWPYEPPSKEFLQASDMQAWETGPSPGYPASEVRTWQVAYDAELLYSRKILAGFLKRIQEKRTATARPLWVFFTADHGEALGEHGATDHGDLLYEEQIRVPFWLKIPGVQAGSNQTPISHVDFFPSLIDLLNLEPQENLPGRSWAPALFGHPIPEVPVYAESRHASFDNAMCRYANVKLVRNLVVSSEQMKRKPRPSQGVPESVSWLKPWEAYDLMNDPLELSRMEGKPAPPADQVASYLNFFLRERGEVPSEYGRNRIASDIVDALRELGYF